MPAIVPPFLCPVATGYRLRLGSGIEVKARYGGFYVYFVHDKVFASAHNAKLTGAKGWSDR